MASLFDTTLSDVSPQSFPLPSGRGSAPPISNKGRGFASVGKSIAVAVDAVGDVFKEDKTAEITAAVDNAITESVNETLGISEKADIERNLSQLEKLKKASSQGRDVTDRFNLTTIQKLKQLKAKYPHHIGMINKLFKEKGIIDPRLALIKEQESIEDAIQADQRARESRLVEEAVKAGHAVFNTPDDPNSGVDRTGTVNYMTKLAVDEGNTKRLLDELGVVADEKGKRSFTLRSNYLVNRRQLHELTFQRAFIGLRPLANKMMQVLGDKNPELDKVKSIKGLFTELATKADQFRLSERINANRLNAAEAEDYMKNVDEVISTFTRGVAGLEESKDLNALKSAALTLNWATQNAGVLNAADAPGLFRLANLSSELANTAINTGKMDRNVMDNLSRLGTSQLMVILDMTPPSATPDATDSNLEGTEEKHSEVEREFRQNYSANLLAKIEKKNMIMKGPADAYTWVQSQAPMFNAAVKDQLSPNDTKTMARLMLNPNYLANLNSEPVKTRFPEQRKQLGAYAFNMVEKHILNLGRELRTSPGVVGKLGVQYDVVYDRGTKKFAVVDLEPGVKGVRTTEGSARGRIKLDQGPRQAFSLISGITDRVSEINKALPFLLQTKEFKDAQSKLTPDEYIARLSQVITGHERDTNATSETKKPAVSNEGNAVIIQGDDDPAYKALKPGDRFRGPDGVVRVFRGN